MENVDRTESRVTSQVPLHQSGNIHMNVANPYAYDYKCN